MELSTFLCTCKHAVMVHEPLIFHKMNCSAKFSTIFGVSATVTNE